MICKFFDCCDCDSHDVLSAAGHSCARNSQFVNLQNFDFCCFDNHDTVSGNGYNLYINVLIVEASFTALWVWPAKVNRPVDRQSSYL